MKFLLLGKPATERCGGALTSHGFVPVPLEPDVRLNRVVASHADTLIFSSGRTLLVSADTACALPDALQSCVVAAGDAPHGSYPTDAALNALVIGRRMFARPGSLSQDVRRIADAKGLELVPVRQGYARCSTLALNAVSAAVTADAGMADAMERCGIRVLRITPGHIALDGCEYGFIGGASFVDEPFCSCSLHMATPCVYFFGELYTHPDGARIRQFIESFGYDVVTLDGALTDYGGAVIADVPAFES